MKVLINSILRNFNYRISKISPLESLSVFQIQKKIIGNNEACLTILDVGAYKGEVTLIYKDLFPGSRIYCFEPFPESFTILKRNTDAFENIFTINKGLGEFNGKTKFHSNRSASTNSVLATSVESEKIWETGGVNTIRTIEVEMITLDSFVELNQIEKIDILKLDVQGSEYKVIEGARNTLDKGIINMIYTEIIVLPSYDGQKYLDEVLGLFRSFGYDLFNFYNISCTHNGQLRQADAIFIKSKSQ